MRNDDDVDYNKNNNNSDGNNDRSSSFKFPDLISDNIPVSNNNDKINMLMKSFFKI